MELVRIFLVLATLTTFPVTTAIVSIGNDGVIDELVVPVTYIVKYKNGIESSARTRHENAVNSKAKNGGKRGILGRFDVAGLRGCVAELSLPDLDTSISSHLFPSYPTDIDDWCPVFTVSEPKLIDSSAPERQGLLAQGALPIRIGMAAVLDLILPQNELAGVGDIERLLSSGLLGKVGSELGAVGAGEEATGRVVRLERLAGDSDAGVGDHLLDPKGRAGVLKDADLHPDLGRPPVLHRLLVEQLLARRVGVGPRLDHHPPPVP
ncbi:hypothetical protein VTH82DRAFT_6138 [Thermothelomyces myriococcoides]